MYINHVNLAETYTWPMPNIALWELESAHISVVCVSNLPFPATLDMFIALCLSCSWAFFFMLVFLYSFLSSLPLSFHPSLLLSWLFVFSLLGTAGLSVCIFREDFADPKPSGQWCSINYITKFSISHLCFVSLNIRHNPEIRSPTATASFLEQGSAHHNYCVEML